MRFYLSLALATLAVTGCVHSRDAASLYPPDVNEWRPAEDAIYTPDTLFEYINGAAEVYLAFNVQSVISRRYVKPGAPDIVADIYDMGSDEDAYGAFHHDMRVGESAALGHESDFAGSALAFWKGRYYVSVMPYDDTDASRRAVLVLGRSIADAIPGKGAKPWVAGVLPVEGLLPGQSHFFHDQLCLNYHHYISSDNVLGLGPETDGMLGRYAAASADGAIVTLIAIRYPSARAAGEAHAQFVKSVVPNLDGGGLGKTGAVTWTGARQSGDLLFLVFGAASRDTARKKLDAMATRAKQPEAGVR